MTGVHHSARRVVRYILNVGPGALEVEIVETLRRRWPLRYCDRCDHCDDDGGGGPLLRFYAAAEGRVEETEERDGMEGRYYL